MESLQAFAQGPAHRAGWDWWDRTLKQQPHLGIRHEVYAAPRGHWENVYVNFQPFGMGERDLGDNISEKLWLTHGQVKRSLLVNKERTI